MLIRNAITAAPCLSLHSQLHDLTRSTVPSLIANWQSRYSADFALRKSCTGPQAQISWEGPISYYKSVVCCSFFKRFLIDCYLGREVLCTNTV